MMIYAPKNLRFFEDPANKIDFAKMNLSKSYAELSARPKGPWA